MSDPIVKEQGELEVFFEFVEVSGLPLKSDSATNRPHPEPDISCESLNGETVAYELCRVCSRRMHEAAAGQLRDGETRYVRLENPLKYIADRKRSRKYETDHPIELVFYSDGWTALSADQIVEELRWRFESNSGRFRRVWFFERGGSTCEGVYDDEESRPYLHSE